MTLRRLGGLSALVLAAAYLVGCALNCTAEAVREQLRHGAPALARIAYAVRGLGKGVADERQ